MIVQHDSDVGDFFFSAGSGVTMVVIVTVCSEPETGVGTGVMVGVSVSGDKRFMVARLLESIILTPSHLLESNYV